MPTARIRAGEIQLGYEIDGPPNAPVICLAHCFGSDLHFWDTVVPALGDFRVLRFDARGHGSSDRPRGNYSLEDMVGDVIHLLDALEIANVHYCGASMGGMVGQMLALNAPERVQSLVLANSPCQYRDEQVAMWRKNATEVKRGGIKVVHDALMQRWFTDHALATQAPCSIYMSQTLQAFSPHSFVSCVAAVSAMNTTDRLRDIIQPTMLVASPDDAGIPVEVSEMMAMRIPSCELHWITPSRHLATLEQPNAFSEHLVKFLERVVV